MIYQWGYVDEGNCGSCNIHSELWTHSGKQVEYHNLPLCAFCHVFYIQRFMNSLEFMDSLDGGLVNLVSVNPVQSPHIYGEAKPFCDSCGQLFVEGAEIAEALDAYGSTRRVHNLCAVECDYCNEHYATSRTNYTFNRYRHNVMGYQVLASMSVSNTTDDCSICNDCVNNNDFAECEHCSNIGDRCEFTRFSNSLYCDGCYEDNVYSCDDCEQMYWDGDGHDCDSGVIKSWDYKPDPEFFKCSYEQTPTYYLGLELEVENTRGSYSTEGMADTIQEHYLKGHAYLKHDGSISDGFEIVTHPHTLESMRLDFDWSALEKLREAGFRSWNASNSSCGIHVHVSRTAFGQNDRRRVADHKRDAHMLRFMKLIYDNQRQVERLAGRTSNRWANFADKGQLVSKVKHGRQENGRYSAINTDNYATLEVRVFKGSLKKERVLSALEFVTASVEYTRDLKVTASNKALSWAKFITYVVANEDMYPNLLSKISDTLASETIEN